MYFPITEWFAAFVLTLAVEAPIVAILLRPSGVAPLRIAVSFVVVNLATHLTVWYVLTQLFVVDTPLFAFVAEGWAIAAETVFYAATFTTIAVRRAFLIAAVANLTSFAVGRALFTLSPSLIP
jgi:hypothetical protein